MSPMSITTEKTFETAIVESLTEQGGWQHGYDKDFDKGVALFPSYILAFLKDTQPKQWEKLAKVHGNDMDAKTIQRICKELELRGTLDAQWLY